jgi:hypothetical protein
MHNVINDDVAVPELGFFFARGDLDSVEIRHLLVQGGPVFLAQVISLSETVPSKLLDFRETRRAGQQGAEVFLRDGHFLGHECLDDGRRAGRVELDTLVGGAHVNAKLFPDRRVVVDAGHEEVDDVLLGNAFGELGVSETCFAARQDRS